MWLHTHTVEPCLLLSFNRLTTNPHLTWSKSLLLPAQAPPSTMPPPLAHSEPPAQKVLCTHSNTCEFCSWGGVHMLSRWPVPSAVQRQMLAFTAALEGLHSVGNVLHSLPLVFFRRNCSADKQSKSLQRYPTQSPERPDYGTGPHLAVSCLGGSPVTQGRLHWCGKSTGVTLRDARWSVNGIW